MQSFLFYSPLEQFEIIPVISFYLGILDFSITNEVVILGLIFFFIYSLFIFFYKGRKFNILYYSTSLANCYRRYVSINFINDF